MAILRATRQILGMGNWNHGAIDTAMASDPALVWDKTRLAFETNAELCPHIRIRNMEPISDQPDS